MDLSRTDLVAVAGVAEAEGYAFIYDFFSAPATHEILVGDVVDGIEGAWTGVSPITSNLEDWSFALFDDPGVPTTGLTADQKKALLYQVLYGIIHGVNLPYMDGSPCFPPVITTYKTLSPGAEKQFYSATLSPIGGVPPYQWEAECIFLDTGLRRCDEGFCSFELCKLTHCRLPKQTLGFS